MALRDWKKELKDKAEEDNAKILSIINGENKTPFDECDDIKRGYTCEFKCLCGHIDQRTVRLIVEKYGFICSICKIFDEKKVIKHTWKNKKNHKECVKRLGIILKYKSMEDWYNISYDIFYENNLGRLLRKYYCDSPIQLLREIFPEYNWLEWKMKSTPNGFWSDIKNRKKYVEWLGNKLGYKSMEDWYNISQKTIIENYGGGLLNNYYSGSHIHLLREVYPEYNWLEWLFSKAPMRTWGNKENHKKYAEWLGNKLGYKSMEDWYNVTYKIFYENNVGGLLCDYYISIIQFLREVYPEYNWDIAKFKKRYSTGGIEWLEYIKLTVPDMRHAENHKDGEFLIPNSLYHADGYSNIKNTIYEFHGDWCHGNIKKHCIRILKDLTCRWKKYEPDEIIWGTTMKEKYENTLKKQKFCEDSGYKYYSIWESDWLRGKWAVMKLQRKFRLKNKL
tara:strand:- start:50 stop:1393 length:1344 start_codon:yes stop_codon:yes gene_type:complete